MLHDLSYLPRQVRRRIESWSDELANHVFVPILPLEWEGFLTYDHLSLESAKEQDFKPFPEGTLWGAKGEYGWFRTSFTLPDEFIGKTIYSTIGVGGEMIVYRNDEAVGSIDRHHKFVYLSFDAKGGHYSLMAEAYAGSGVLLEGGGPIPLNRSVYPPIPKAQQKVNGAEIGYICEEAYQLQHDVYTLTNLLEILEPTSLQAETIVNSLLEFTKIVDFETSKELIIESFVEARKMLSPLMKLNNGSCAPTFTVFGQSHIDLAWKWTVEETKRKCGRTFSNQLTLLKQYPDYKFLLCEPALIELLRKYHPDVFSRVKEFMKTGQIISEGAFWVESDTNIPNAESLIKQLVYGQRWFKSETGNYSTFAWLPDTFGFTASLPQLLKQVGVESFGTQKLLRADPESSMFPFTDFWWEGEDGSKILSNMSFRNNCAITPKELYTRWHVNRKQHENIDSLIYPFGYGDGGGGPDRDLVEQMVRLSDLQGIPRTRIEGPKDYFDRIRTKVTNVHSGELYLAWHRGTYSSQQNIKKLNSQCEKALREYSFWASLLGKENPSQLENWWKTLLFNQFHDILSGVSIHAVNKQAEGELKGVIDESSKALRSLLSSAVTQNNGKFSVLNSSIESVKTWVSFPKKGCVYQDSKLLPSYKDENGTCALVTLNPATSTIFEIRDEIQNTNGSLVNEKEDGFYFSNGKMSFFVDRNAIIHNVSIDGLEICSSANDFVLYQDINPDYDAWEIGRFSKDLVTDHALVEKMRIITNTPSMARLILSLKIGNSSIEQIISFDSESNEIKISLEVDWKERHKILKTITKHTFVSDNYFCDTQLGYKTLPLHENTVSDRDRYEVCAQSWAAVGDERATLLLMNSYPFGFSARHKQLGITLLRSALIPDDTAENGMHSLNYSIALELESFSGMRAKQKASLLSMRALVIPGELEISPVVSLREGNAIVTILEKNKNGSLLMRFSNPGRSHQHLVFSTQVECEEILECNLLEEKQQKLEFKDDFYKLELPPFSLKTILFKEKKAKYARN